MRAVTMSSGVLLALASGCWGGGLLPDGGSGAGGGGGSTEPLPFVTLAAHGYTCGATADGRTACWGWNVNGNLGDGTGDTRLVPALVAGPLRAKQLTASRSPHTCAVDLSGAAWCWGNNRFGQLGDGTTRQRLTPTAVAGGLQLAQVSASLNFTCGVTAGDQAFCWGANGSGQLGDGTTTQREVPTAVTGGLAFRQVSAGEAHACGVTPGGLAYCWGTNDQYGRLGDGTLQQRLEPTPVQGANAFRSVSAGATHTCGLATSGRVFCWGDNPRGQLGDGTTTRRLAPAAVPGSGTFNAVHASGTGAFTCALASDGSLSCWGSNDSGVFGDGTTMSSLVPTAAGGGLRFSTVAVGAAHVCGVTTGGETYCWGEGALGRLGDGTGEDRRSPVRVAAPE